jgi:hypothetical protein
LLEGTDTLRRDIFDIKFPGVPFKDVRLPNPNSLAAAHYPCIYWVDHLQDSGCEGNDGLILDERGLVDTFLQQKYLQWIEAISLLENLSQGIRGILKLDGLL